MVDAGEQTVNVNEGIQVQTVRLCLLCGNEGYLVYRDLRDRLFGVPGTWQFLRCPDCNLMWLNPRPAPSDVGKLYESYFTHAVDDQPRRWGGLRREIKNAILADRFGYREFPGGVRASARVLGRVVSWVRPVVEDIGISIMTLQGPANGKLLDVGCGNGEFLHMMRQLGWDVTGVEPDGQAVSIARGRFGLDVHEGTLEAARFLGGAFDAVTMSHVLEHLRDPVSTLEECRRVLRPGGKLVIVTPNSGSPGHWLFKEAWRGLEVPRHLFLFSMQSLQKCAERAGLRVIELRTSARSARWMWTASRFVRREGALHGGSPRELSLHLRLEGLAFWAVEQLLCRFKGVGEELILIALGI